MNKKCICACHDTEWNSPKLHLPVEHDTQCCENMNGYMSAPTQPENNDKEVGIITSLGMRLERDIHWEAPPPSDSKGWEERFDEEYPKYTEIPHLPPLKDFIRTEIEVAEERICKLFENDFSRGYGEGLKQGRLDVIAEILEKLPKLPDYGVGEWESGAFSGAEDYRTVVIDLLTVMRKN